MTKRTDILDGEKWHLHQGDCIEHMYDMPWRCFDFAIFSPPFPSLYAYTKDQCDIGNSEDMKGDAKLHLSWFYNQLARLIKPGRVLCVHVAQIPRMKRANTDGGLYDFRGLNIRLAERAGFIFGSDIPITKNPQALKNGTRVLTPTGWVAIEELGIGSLVMGSRGRPIRVTGIHKFPERQMYRVTFFDGAYIDCDGQHRWTVLSTRDNAKYSYPSVLTAKELCTHGANTDSGDARFAVPLIEPVCFQYSHDNLPLHPYTLGVLLGDGLLSSRGTVGACTEQEIMDLLPLPDGHSIRKLPRSEVGNNVASYHILGDRWHHNQVLDDCRKLRIHGLRAWEKSIPHDYLFAPSSVRLSVLQGLMDTDGTIKQNGSCYFATTSEQLAKDVQFIVESLGGLSRLSSDGMPRYTYKGVVKWGRERFVCSVRLPREHWMCPFRMSRKAGKWKPLQRKIHRRIVSIDEADRAPCTCVTVDAADGLFATEHCILTHNSQAIRTRSRELQFAGLEKDRANTRPALSDYILKFNAPGENAVPVDTKGEVTRNEWIEWAEGVWTWHVIKDTATLNKAAGRDPNDTKHICPLQLEVIRRLVKLYTNPGEIVFSPFAGIGSEGFVALKNDRRFYGCEIKESYIATARKNLKAASSINEWQYALFDECEQDQAEVS